MTLAYSSVPFCAFPRAFRPLRAARFRRASCLLLSSPDPTRVPTQHGARCATWDAQLCCAGTNA